MPPGVTRYWVLKRFIAAASESVTEDEIKRRGQSRAQSAAAVFDVEVCFAYRAAEAMEGEPEASRFASLASRLVEAEETLEGEEYEAVAAGLAGDVDELVRRLVAEWKTLAPPGASA